MKNKEVLEGFGGEGIFKGINRSFKVRGLEMYWNFIFNE